MNYCDLELKNQIEFKLIRLNKPKFNYGNTPLFGDYVNEQQKFNSNSDDTMLSQDALLKNYNITEILTISNLMMISNTFGKILYGETLEAMIIIINLSKTDDIHIRELKIILSNEPLPNYTSFYKSYNETIFHAQNLVVPCGEYYTNKISINPDNICKYCISAEIDYSCNYFNTEYYRQSQGKIIKTENTVGYLIDKEKGLVVKKYQKKLLFDNNLPFNIKEKMITTNLNKIFIEISIINNTLFTLHILNYSLQVNRHLYGKLKEDETKKLNQKIFPVKKVEEFSIDSEDEYNIIFYIEDYEFFKNIENFSFKINWTNTFDFLPKQLSFIVKNRHINDLISLTLYETPNSMVITKDELFTVKIQINNIHGSKLRFY